MDNELNLLLDGYDRLIKELKRTGKMSIKEGKLPLSVEGYKIICKRMLTSIPSGVGSSWQTSIFGWAFLVTMWNLMSRSESVDALMFHHISWEQDCMIIEEQGHKGDQSGKCVKCASHFLTYHCKGEDKFGKHVYANPYEATNCPVLALASM